MNRRFFLSLASAVALATPGFAGDAKPQVTIDFHMNPIEVALAQGQTVFVDYGTEWCTTCAAQKRTIGRLRGDNPEYDEHLTFVHVDYDDFRDHPVAVDRNIPRRSTLIVLHGDQELGRIVAGTSTAQIKELMDTALAAAKGSADS